MKVEPHAVVLHAHAKINVHLSIGPASSDGYHQLLSLFLLIGLFDTLELEVRRSDRFSCAITGVPDVELEQNTMYRSARTFSEAVGLPLEVRISCLKRIPSQAGLGGGSSDAASVLRGLDMLCGTKLGQSQLLSLAAQVGSDVPFFASGAGAALVEGKGELVTPVSPRDDLACLVAMPAWFAHSTRGLFSALDQSRMGKDVPWIPDGLPLLHALASPCAAWPFRNDFREVCGEHESWYAMLDQVASSRPGCFGTMTGSGAAYVFMAEDPCIVDGCMLDLKKKSLDASLFRTKCLHGDQTGATLRLW